MASIVTMHYEHEMVPDVVEEPGAVHAQVVVPCEQRYDAVGHHHLQADQFALEVFVKPRTVHFNQPVNTVEENQKPLSIREFSQTEEFLGYFLNTIKMRCAMW